jgi:hypothetical protein
VEECSGVRDGEGRDVEGTWEWCGASDLGIEDGGGARD